MIFVFGSNEGGYHGAGAAKTAAQYHGAVMGKGFGHYGSSFAIPTKDATIKHTLPLGKIKGYVEVFMAYARAHPEFNFQVTRIGCGLAGLRDEQIAPMFLAAPDNCYFDEKWAPYVPANAKFWGTF